MKVSLQLSAVETLSKFTTMVFTIYDFYIQFQFPFVTA